MRSALAKGLGVSEDAVKVDFSTKTANVDLGTGTPDLDALAKVMDATRFSAALTK